MQDELQNSKNIWKVVLVFHLQSSYFAVTAFESLWCEIDAHIFPYMHHSHFWIVWNAQKRLFASHHDYADYDLTDYADSAIQWKDEAIIYLFHLFSKLYRSFLLYGSVIRMSQRKVIGNFIDNNCLSLQESTISTYSPMRMLMVCFRWPRFCRK